MIEVARMMVIAKVEGIPETLVKDSVDYLCLLFVTI